MNPVKPKTVVRNTRPEDFDGIIVGAPVLNFTGTMLHYIQVAKALRDAPIATTQLPLLASKIYAKCDAADGITFFIGSILFTLGGALQSRLAWSDSWSCWQRCCAGAINGCATCTAASGPSSKRLCCVHAKNRCGASAACYRPLPAMTRRFRRADRYG